MSKVIKKAAPIDPITNSLVNDVSLKDAMNPSKAIKQLGGGDGDAGAAPADKAPSNARIDNRTQQIALREEMLGRQAAAGDATRSESDADLLGFSRSGAKRRGQARKLLG